MKYLTFIFLLFTAFFVRAQNNLLDIEPTPAMYERVLATESPDAVQFDTIWQVISAYSRKSKDTMLTMTQHMLKVTKDSPNRVLYGKALYLNGVAMPFDSAYYAVMIQARDILKEEKDTFTLSKVYMGLGLYYQTLKDWDASIDVQLKAVDLLEEQDDALGLSNAVIGIGGTYFQLGNIKKAIVYLDRCIDILTEAGETHGLSAMYSNKAKALGQLGKQYAASADTASINPQVYRDTSVLFYQRGLTSAQRALDYAVETENIMAETASYNAVSGLHNSLGNYREGLTAAQSAMRLAEQLGRQDFIEKSQFMLATSYKNLGEYRAALKYAEAAYGDGKYGGEENLYEIYKGLGQTDKALLMLEKINKREKDNRINDNRKLFAEAEAKYQTAEKEKQILLQQNDILHLEANNLRVERQRNFLFGGGLLLFLIGFFGYRFQKVRKDRNDKKEFAEALIFAQEEERKRIARDLHDSVGQSLLLLIKNTENNNNIASENKHMIAQTLEEVRSISGDLHPFKLDKFGLTATIEDTIDKVEKSTDIFITRDLDNIDGILSAKSEIHLFRTIQEAWNNIIKHSQATAAKITSRNTDKNLKIEIQDNGKGFDLELAIVTSKSLGIRTMHERIQAIGGELKIGGGTNGGTLLTIVIPKK